MSRSASKTAGKARKSRTTVMMMTTTVTEVEQSPPTPSPAPPLLPHAPSQFSAAATQTSGRPRPCRIVRCLGRAGDLASGRRRATGRDDRTRVLVRTPVD